MKTYSYQSTEQIGHQASIGLIVLSSDEVLEYELREWLQGTGVALYVSRVPMAELNTPETLGAMENHLTQAASLLPPHIHYDAIAYGCTSASAVIGHRQVDALLSRGRRAHYFTNPLKALEMACSTHKLRSLDVLSPYTEASMSLLLHALQKAGLIIQHTGTFNEETDTQVARISPRSISEAATDLSPPGTSDALFLSCTNLRTKDALSGLTRICEKPVLSSNSALAWHLAQLCGLGNPVWSGY